MKRIFAFSIVFALAIFMLDITALPQGIKGKVGIKINTIFLPYSVTIFRTAN